MATTEPTTTETETIPTIHWMNDAEACAEFDAEARHWLGVSGGEFLRGWDAGEYRDTIDDEDHPGVLMVAMLIPWVRP